MPFDGNVEDFVYGRIPTGDVFENLLLNTFYRDTSFNSMQQTIQERFVDRDTHAHANNTQIHKWTYKLFTQNCYVLSTIKQIMKTF